jgi:hypothetical protein
VSISGQTATIDLSSTFASGGGALSMTNRLAQVVYTATQFPTATAVRFKLDGKAVTVFGGEGIILDHPQRRSDYEASSPAILIEHPVWMGTLSSGTVVRGTADVFEAVFRLQVRDRAGKLLLNAVVHATAGTGTRGIWSRKLTWTSAAKGEGELKAFAASPKDGTPIDVVTIPVLIQSRRRPSRSRQRRSEASPLCNRAAPGRVSGEAKRSPLDATRSSGACARAAAGPRTSSPETARSTRNRRCLPAVRRSRGPWPARSRNRCASVRAPHRSARSA